MTRLFDPHCNMYLSLNDLIWQQYLGHNDKTANIPSLQSSSDQNAIHFSLPYSEEMLFRTK